MPETPWENTIRHRYRRTALAHGGDVPVGWITDTAQELGLSLTLVRNFVASIRAPQGKRTYKAEYRPTPKALARKIEQARQEHLAKLRASNPTWSHYQPRIYRDPGGYSHAG